MRLMILYDFPRNDQEINKEISNFRKELDSLGFYRFQYSVYTLLIARPEKAKEIEKKLKVYVPSNGICAIILLTEKQFNNVKLLVGKYKPSEPLNHNQLNLF